MSGLEALVRWQHPELGLVPPAKFIPIAEKSGLINQVADWVDNPDHAQRMLAELKAMGLLLSIDGFGTGHSSLSYLRRFSLNELKIDRSFVDEVASNADDHAIAQAIIAMAQALGLSVVAEGIETQEQVDVLRKLGCRIGQGYFFAMPMSADEIAAKYFP